jgi:hypothetical protein
LRCPRIYSQGVGYGGESQIRTIHCPATKVAGNASEARLRGLETV